MPSDERLYFPRPIGIMMNHNTDIIGAAIRFHLETPDRHSISIRTPARPHADPLTKDTITSFQDTRGAAPVSNGLSLCRIHHGAYDTNILGIDPDYKVVIKDSVLATFDGPTLQHALKEMHGAELTQVPTSRAERPDRGLLDERFQSFLRAS